MHLSQSMICANLSPLLTMHPSRLSNAKENKAGHVRVQPTKLLRYTERIEICYTWTKTWEAVISKHSKASWRYYDIIRRQKHISECLAYLTDWYHHMSKQLAKWSLRQRLTSSQVLIQGWQVLNIRSLLTHARYSYSFPNSLKPWAYFYHSMASTCNSRATWWMVFHLAIEITSNQTFRLQNALFGGPLKHTRIQVMYHTLISFCF